MARRSGNQFALCLALAFITEHHARLGDASGALAGLVEAERLAREPLNRVLLAMVLMVKGNLAMCEERFSDAIVAYKECIDLHNSTRVFGPIGWAQNGMAYAYMRVGQPERARQVFGESLETGRICGNRAMALSNWVGFAALAAEAGDLQRAARLMGAADSMQRKTRYVPWTSNQGLFALAQRMVMEKLPPEELAAERSKGERLPPEEVSAMALGKT